MCFKTCFLIFISIIVTCLIFYPDFRALRLVPRIDEVPPTMAQPIVANNQSLPNKSIMSNNVPCVATMDLTNFLFLTDLARRYDQTPFDHLVIPRLRYHFDERFAPKSQSRDSSAMIMLFMYHPEEDWGQNELIDASLKVWFGTNSGNVATIDIAEMKSLDEVRKIIYEVIKECEYTIIRFKNAELKLTSKIIQILQDVRHLSLPDKKVLDGSKAIYFFEYGVFKTHIHRNDFSKQVGQYRQRVVGDPWHEYFDSVELVQNITHILTNSTFDHMLGSRMRVSVVPFVPIPRASVKNYLKEKAFKTLEPNTAFAQDEYLTLIEKQNPGITVYKYMDATDCIASPLSLPCLRSKCNDIGCISKKIQFTGNSATCNCI